MLKQGSPPDPLPKTFGFGGGWLGGAGCLSWVTFGGGFERLPHSYLNRALATRQSCEAKTVERRQRARGVKGQSPLRVKGSALAGFGTESQLHRRCNQNGDSQMREESQMINPHQSCRSTLNRRFIARKSEAIFVQRETRGSAHSKPGEAYFVQQMGESRSCPNHDSLLEKRKRKRLWKSYGERIL